MTGATIALYVEPNENVASVKGKFQALVGSPELPRLIFIAKVLENHLSLADYNVKPDSTIAQVIVIG